ncbi:hypothetical protein H112_06163 [Trichophyton rubrum D6]|uniref:Uncharacterized protein n=3 Tax=Trichophyton TaxID=5550 RepID=A0A080WG68_TRIRC|nr:uncharacterized protein TERG_12068 [Trichophyton rubrum CBS 118892]EZF14354.1 hypothetical protein H100_06177 [Trichophyton rubrum MR850]EZF39845.1 hypothetical protein H102_06146 [Trichophyton rubrum CBS 100081]EZF50473.1 hypothetical protein H103_06170 [Trichophyton rubrum CBS 288.86]EZF61066.1 hypothetical protein H104_06158 [Trichophyton rubrum CBS 289.86]EZF71623.1 hypothetical protein H105_06183 [Trichophyton soudanense CBS 452.61]EZF82536.1 hypothetical protein H110_06166 [Trichophy
MVTAVDKDGRQRRQQQHRSQHGAMSVQRYLIHSSSASECPGWKPASLPMRAGGRPSGYINGIRAVETSSFVHPRSAGHWPFSVLGGCTTRLLASPLRSQRCIISSPPSGSPASSSSASVCLVLRPSPRELPE